MSTGAPDNRNAASIIREYKIKQDGVRQINVAFQLRMGALSEPERCENHAECHGVFNSVQVRRNHERACKRRSEADRVVWRDTGLWPERNR